jgi:hypothetical protein
LEGQQNYDELFIFEHVILFAKHFQVDLTPQSTDKKAFDPKKIGVQ